MKKVITYGTYDLFHQGHYNLLKRAKALGDYLIVGITSDYFDKSRGKFNVHDDLMTRVENVKKTGFADKIVIEEYVGQKIDDIQKYNVDIFTVGSDWKGYFDYLNEYCKVIYLERTEGISSTKIRNAHCIRLGVIGNERILDRFLDESKFVSGMEIAGQFAENDDIDYIYKAKKSGDLLQYFSLENLFKNIDAVYINAPLSQRSDLIEKALKAGKHVLTEFPFCPDYNKAKELLDLARENNLLLMEGLKTAYCPAFGKLIALVKSGRIGKVLSVEANFTQILGKELENQIRIAGGSMLSLGAYPLLAIFKLLGYDYKKIDFISHQENGVDTMTRMNFVYDHAMASALVAINAKAEGDLVISGTKGYVYVPAPWWKTEYYELRYEDINKNSKFFYKFEGEGLRYEIVEFIKNIKEKENLYLAEDDILAESKVLQVFQNKNLTSYF
ncbi:adenylyltransferase/cytidyltransferase family protein [Acidaminococcus sp.]|uniref:adenylyltransferase/cytidyltransferase family protein n=1 Tax=Acidaminococcus sp. TaxID=1872103 RepID=UPI003D7CDD97